MRLATPTAGIGIGGGVTAAALVALKLGVKPDATKPPDQQKVRIFAMNHSAKIAWGLGLISAAALAVTKRKQAAVAAAISSSVVGLPAVILEVKAAHDAAAAAQPQLPQGGATNGFGIAVAEARGFGAPAVELFSAAPSGVELSGTASTGGQPSFSPAAFGGGVF